MINKYLFLFTIGPVQSFISSARKTKDLYSGSKILSDLTSKAINEFSTTQNKNNVIFPYPDLESKPNRFLAIVENESPEFLGKRIEDKVKDFFLETGINLLKGKGSESFIEKFKDQLSDFLSIYWAAVPYDENNYDQDYEKLERFLASIKNIKPFKQLPDDEKNRKCSLSGERDALIFTSNGKLPIYSLQDALRINSLQLSQGEGLSAVSFMKRFYENANFPSTAEICLMEVFNKINKDIKDFYREKEYQLCYEDNLTDKYLRNNFIETSLSELIKKQSELVTETKVINVKLTKYYAVLVFDGDSMGDWLSGKYLKDKTKLQEFHRRMSEKLGEFAKLSKDYLQNPKGQAVYAGGDDFLGFVNINHVFETLKYLREKFSETMKPLREYTNGKEFTFSAGVSIAHYKTPLGEALKSARLMEKKAKLSKDKDSFAISVLKKSGEIHESVYKFKAGEIFLPEVFDSVSKMLANDYFSNTFARSLEIELKSISDEQDSPDEDDLKIKIIDTEIKRLIKRSLFPDKEITYVNKLSIGIGLLFKTSSNIKNFLYTLNILMFIKREIDKEVNVPC